MQPSLAYLVDQLPTPWVERFVATFEAGRVQKHPHARFVNAQGECCLVGAMAGARTSAEFASSEVAGAFRGSALETLSRGFEARRFTAQEVYVEALLTLAARSTHLDRASLAGSVGAEPVAAVASI